MNENGRNDYDSIEEQMGNILLRILSSIYADTMIVNQDELLKSLIEFSRLRDWVGGLADSHRSYAFSEKDRDV